MFNLTVQGNGGGAGNSSFLPPNSQHLRPCRVFAGTCILTVRATQELVLGFLLSQFSYMHSSTFAIHLPPSHSGLHETCNCPALQEGSAHFSKHAHSLLVLTPQSPYTARPHCPQKVRAKRFCPCRLAVPAPPPPSVTAPFPLFTCQQVPNFVRERAGRGGTAGVGHGNGLDLDSQ